MRVPGFTAEGSLAGSGRRYRGGGSPSRTRVSTVTPQAHHEHRPIVLERTTPHPPQHCSGIPQCLQMLGAGVCPTGQAVCTDSECWC